MKEFAYVTLDVFTNTRFGGNQLAVILDARGLSSEQMQTIAREFNFSESTFVLPPQNPANTAQVRIFTPGGELPFAGHPTVGTAFALAALSKVPADTASVTFEESVGDVPVAIERTHGQVSRTVLTAPRNPIEEALDATTQTMCGVLGIATSALHKTLPVRALSTGNTTIAVPLATRADLANCELDTAQWKALSAATREHQYYPCVINAAARTAYVRMFVPGHGVMEDAATGSAAASFAGYLAKYIETEDGTHAWTIHQGIEMGRPSEIALSFERVSGAAKNVRVGGSSVLVMQGTLQID
jgi:trans-2,3-dihydro-3-hydroxyanthranilate isomerase